MHDFEIAAFSAMSRLSPDATIGFDTDGRILSWNGSAERNFGFSSAEMIGHAVAKLAPPGGVNHVERNLDRVLRGDAVRSFEMECTTKSGHLIRTTVAVEAVRNDAGHAIGGVMIAKASESSARETLEASRLAGLSSALSAINQAIVRCRTRQQLFDDVCAILVDKGGFKTALVLVHDEKTKQIAPVARAFQGPELPEIASSYFQIFSDDRPEGQGPGGRAFRTGLPVICNDIASDPTTRQLWEKVRHFGLLSLADFPIFSAGSPFGLLVVNSDEKDYFQEAEILLLREAASDISSAIDMLETNMARDRAEALARSEQGFSDAMINAMPGVVYFYDTEGRFVRWNSNFEAVTGYSHDEIATMHPLDFFAEEERPCVAAAIDEVFRSGDGYVEANFRTKTGLLVAHYFTGCRVQMDEKEYLVGVGIDISARRSAEEASRKSEQRYRVLFEHAPDGILIGTPDSFIDANESMCRMLGLTRSQIVGRRAADFVARSDLSRIGGALRAFKHGSGYREQWQLRRSDNTAFPAEVIATRLPDGNVIAMARDVSDREAAAEALLDLNKTLEHRVKERTLDLATALAQAENADRIKSAFLANMSHELRTPLNSIIGFTGILLQGLAGPLNAEQHKQLGMVRKSSRHLLDLINDVLDISKIEAGQLMVRQETFDLSDCIANAVNLIRPAADKKGLSLVVHAEALPATMIADRRRVAQILLNLLSNAVKFTTIGGITLTVDVDPDYRSLGAEDRGCAAVRFAISDTGIGIEPNNLNSLFQPFRQLDSGLARQHDGTGLGLAISRRLARLMGGEVSASSVPGRGSTFTVAIPLGESEVT